jgi:2-methylcitrate dehydratase PrpD
MAQPSQALAQFAANLSFEEIPPQAIEYTKELFVDWLGACLSGKGARPAEAIEHFAREMGPANGDAEILTSRRSSSPLFAAMVNAAASHATEQDDIHNSAALHAGTVVFPAALAAGQALGSSGGELLTAAVAGYEVGIRVGEFLGRSHYKIFHTTGTAGTLAAAAAVGRLLRLTPEQMLDAFGSAGTQAAGLWEFLRDAADSKQLHTAKAASDGLLSAYLAQQGFRGARQILEGPRGMGAGLSQDAEPAKLTDRLGERWAVLETSFKYHASCRHTHSAADALGLLMKDHALDPQSVSRVTVRLYQSAIDVLGPVVNPQTVHQSKFSMGTVLGMIAVFGRAGVTEFEHSWNDPRVAAFREKVSMEYDPDLDRMYPQRWAARVIIETANGHRFERLVDEAKGDPGNRLTRAEIEEKALSLVEYSVAATADEMKNLFAMAWQFEKVHKLETLLAVPTTVQIRS